MKNAVRRSLARTPIYAALFVIAPSISFAANTPIKRPGGLTSISRHLQPLGAPAAEVEVFVRLNEPAVSEINVESVEQTGALASSAAQQAQAQRIDAQQAAFKSTLEAHGATILSSQRVGANGFRVSIPAARINSLRTLPGVRSIGRVELHTINHFESVPSVGAPAVWSSLNLKGKGVRVGVIDSGIDYLHANFGGSGLPADYVANDRNVVEPGTFPTAKVVGGIDLAGATYNANVRGSTPTPDADPLDRGGHGTHVAGSVAGIGVGTSVGPGVAPEASLYAIKVFGDNGGSTGLTSLGIEWAMDPNGDGDMSDHLDVINMSLGSAFGDPNDPTAISSTNAAALGIIVVTSAGNEGPTPYVTGSPGAARGAIATAAVNPSGRVYATFTVTAPASVARVYPAIEGAGPVLLKDVPPIVGSVVPSVPANGCTAFTNAAQVANQIALVIRGGCNFLVKYQNAQTAGARAIVVYSSGPTGAGENPIVMGGLDATVRIPGVMIGFTPGTLLASTPDVLGRLEAAADPAQDNRLSDFSSLGPAGAESNFKPDLSAPGVSIVSAAVGTGTAGVAFDGTSMASPHVAGAAAILRQKHPHLKPAAIKALLQNSTANANASYDTRLTRQGVGVLRIDRAAALSSYASPGGVSFGRINPLFPVWRTERIQLTGLTSDWRHFTAKHVANRSMPGVEVTCPSHVVTRGKHSTNAHIALKFDPQKSWDQGIADNASVSQTEVDGWCVFSDGKDELRVGYIAVVDPASGVVALPSGRKQVSVRNLGPSLGWAEAFTLAKVGGEVLNGTSNSIAAVGFRRGDATLYGIDVLEFGIATEKPFTHISNLIFDMVIDFDSDGTPDAELLTIDLSRLDPTVDPGTYVSVQIDAEGSLLLDWEVGSWDFNDRTAILPFTLASAGGFLPEKFDYTLYAISDDGSEDIQHGSVDLAREIVPDVNSFGVGPRDKVEVNMSGGTGASLWLFQNNILPGQIGVSVSR